LISALPGPFVLTHKMREAMATELKGTHLGGEGETVKIDGGYFGGYVKPTNMKENRRDRRLVKNQNGEHKVVVMVGERGGSTARQHSSPRAQRRLGSLDAWTGAQPMSPMKPPLEMA
jgi:hypothetical protein